MLKDMTPKRAALVIAVIGFATIAGAWIFEYFGYAPCELCLKQRWAYYAAIPVAVIVALIAGRDGSFLRNGLWVLAAIWIASMVFGIYHSGVEWKWWPGPDTCTGTGALTGGLPDLSAPVVMCDQAALRIMGLSLAGWNAVISFALAVTAIAGAKAHGSSSVSQ